MGINYPILALRQKILKHQERIKKNPYHRHKEMLQNQIKELEEAIEILNRVA